jgi:hypothetical protein
MKTVFLFIVSIFLLVGCNPKKKDAKAPANDTLNVDVTELHDSLKQAQDAGVVHASNKDSVLMSLTKEILTSIKNKQYTKLDSFIHPTEGIRFSPYATIDPSSDKKFSKEAFLKLVTTNRNKKINWGSYDGSGNPILLTPNEYFKTFVYDANFVKPNKAGVNKFLSGGNSVNNLKKFYGNADFTESYFSGSKKYGRADWKTVRLVFKQVDGKYYLIAIVHNQWTI